MTCMAQAQAKRLNEKKWENLPQDQLCKTHVQMPPPPPDAIVEPFTFNTAWSSPPLAQTTDEIDALRRQIQGCEDRERDLLSQCRNKDDVIAMLREDVDTLMQAKDSLNNKFLPHITDDIDVLQRQIQGCEDRERDLLSRCRSKDDVIAILREDVNTLMQAEESLNSRLLSLEKWSLMIVNDFQDKKLDEDEEDTRSQSQKSFSMVELPGTDPEAPH